jgi:hypothetical protein
LKLSSILALSTLSLLTLGAAAQAALIVNWGSTTTYVSANRALLIGGYDGGANDFNVISPATSVYFGPEFAGELSSTDADTNVFNAAGSDRLQVKDINWALVLFQQEHFLEAGTIDFGTGSSISMNVINDVVRANHLVLRSNGNYYISGDINSGITAYSVDPTTVSWFNYNPSGDPGDLSSLTPASIVVGGIIPDIEAVGFLSLDTTVANDNFSISSFVVDAIAIPEPASALLLTLATPLLLRRRR